MNAAPFACLHQTLQPRPRRGFTVLELIVALTLGLVLLSAVWTMFRLFLRHQEIESAQVERTQLVSSLHQLLSRDLLNVIPEGREGPQGSGTPAGAPAGAPAPALPLEPTNPLFLFPGGAMELPGLLPANANAEASAYTLPVSSLQGDSRRLELVVFAGPDDSAEPAVEARGGRRESRQDEREPARLPSKVIVYEFTGLSDDLASARDASLAPAELIDRDEDPIEAAIATVGLCRRETQGGSSGVSSSREQDRRGSPESQPVPRSSQPSLASLADEPRMIAGEPPASQIVEEFAPEIIDLRFEYFDGRKWTSSWDSQRQRRLPVLVRAQLALETRPAVRERKLKERLEAGPELDSEIASERSSADEASFDVPSAADRRPSTAAGNDLFDSPWDYEFLLYVTAPPSGSSRSENNRGNTPNTETGDRPPAGPAFGDSSRPRSGGLKQ
ncbi:MAG: type II secretion system protein J [Planctomycetota bacterium]